MRATGAPDLGGARPAEELKVHRSLKRKLVIGLAALALAAFAGGAYAATQSSSPNTRQAFLNDVAKRLHVTPQQLSAALSGATLDQLQAAVKAGRLTQSQANKLEQRLKQNGTAPALPFGFFARGARGPRSTLRPPRRPRRTGGPGAPAASGSAASADASAAPPNCRPQRTTSASVSRSSASSSRPGSRWPRSRPRSRRR